MRLTFTAGEAQFGRKTLKYCVTNEPGETLGEVKWHGAWRAYCFFPAAGALFDRACLRELADFCERATDDQRALWVGTTHAKGGA
jgi:hypothetical protein